MPLGVSITFETRAWSNETKNTKHPNLSSSLKPFYCRGCLASRIRALCQGSLCKHQVLLWVYMTTGLLPFQVIVLAPIHELPSSVTNQTAIPTDWTFTKERIPEGKRIGTWYARQAANTLVLFLCIILCYSIIMCDWSLRDYTSLSVHSTQSKSKMSHYVHYET